MDVDAAEIGSGPAVVFANDSGNSACAWLPLARTIAGQGLRAVVFTYADYSEAQSTKDMIAVARAAAGGHGYALVGASLGGRMVIENAAGQPAGLAAIVSLSGERVVDTFPDILPQARKVRIPALYVGARSDPFTDGSQQQLQLHRAMRGRPNVIIQVAGTRRGTDLLDVAAPDHTSIGDHIVAFVRAQLH